MAASPLSPKKYVETKARTLPIYKCLINKDWKEASEANVFVMRKHVNGNVTAGVYLIDLLCVGIKDTFFIFNEPEQELYDRFPTDIEETLDEVEYALAHNIIYAGHDFALEFGIEPNKEFAVTKYILEEDNDTIPLIEIPVGDEEGLPHLVVHQPGQWSNVLAKLEKNAGKGNYRYTIDGVNEDDFDEDEEWEEDDEPDESELLKLTIAEHELGSITPNKATFLSGAEIDDFDKIEERTGIEKMTLLAEQALRRYRKATPGYFETDYTEENELPGTNGTFAFAVTESEEETYFDNFEEEILKADAEMPSEKRDEYFQSLLDNHADKLLVMASVFESEWNNNGPLLPLARERLQNLDIYPLARLELALANLLEPAPAAGFEEIYTAPGINKLFPEMEAPGDKDLSVFWLMKTVLYLQQNDIAKAVNAYELFSEADVFNFMVSTVQVNLIEAIDKALKQ